MRILHVLSNSTLEDTADRVRLLATTLPQQEFEQHVCELRSSSANSPRIDGVGERCYVVQRRCAADPVAFRELQRAIARLQPDIVHTWQTDAGRIGRLAAVAAGVPRLIASQHSIERAPARFVLVADRALDRRTCRFVVSSVAVREACLAKGWPHDKLLTIPSAVAATEPAQLSRPELLAELHLPESSKLIVCIAALVGENRLKELIWAADQLKAVGAEAHLLLVGDGPLRSRLERYRWLNGVDDRVHFLGRNRAAHELLAHADVCWHAGTKLGQSSAVLAAMAAGVPVVAADAAGNRELIRHGETGYLVSVGERAGFARWTLPLIENRDLATAIGAAGQAHVATSHRAEQMAEQYARLYREVMTEAI